MNTMTYKGYNARVEFDDQDEIFVGHIAGIHDRVGFHADAVKELKSAFHEAVDDYIETCAKVGKDPQKPFSGRVMFRISPEVHRGAVIVAELKGVSLNQWAEDTLSEAVYRFLPLRQDNQSDEEKRERA